MLVESDFSTSVSDFTILKTRRHQKPENLPSDDLHKPDECSTINSIKSPYLTLTEAAAYCRLKPKTLLNRRKEIERVAGVRKLLFTQKTLDRWLNSRPGKRSI